jgi:hypothetical protein
VIHEEKEEEIELLQKSQKTVKVVLECLGIISGQCDIFLQLLQSLPLVDARQTHQEALARMERTCLEYRNQLERASESVAALGLDLPECVNYHSLNLIALAVQQCRKIQGLFGNLRCRECMWVKEVAEPAWSNCLKDDVSFWKLLLSHRQVMYLLEATDDDQSWKKKNLAVNLRNIRQCPLRVPCAGRDRKHAKQNAHTVFEPSEYDLSGGPTLLIRGFEMGFCDDIQRGSMNTRRLLFQPQFFEKVAEEKLVSIMIAAVKEAFSKSLQHLITLDDDKRHMDRNSGQWVSENSDVWVWAKVVARL